MNDELLNQATENASARDDGEWGYRITLEPGDRFLGRWRGETATSGDFGEQPVYLLWDRDGQDCFIYGGRVVLDRKIRAAAPGTGDSIAIARIEDEFANGRTLHRFGIATGPNESPLPGEDVQEELDW
jgi:hypothetical protein